jgi:hypothetical protein
MASTGAALAFVYKLCGPVFRVRRKHENLIAKPAFRYIQSRVSRFADTDVGSLMSPTILYQLRHELCFELDREQLRRLVC